MIDLPFEGAGSLVLAARVLAILLFASALLGKARHWSAFTGVVANYKVLPEILATPAAATVILLEAAVVVGMAVAPVAPVATLLAVVLLLGFAAAIAINLARGNSDIDCGCFQSALRQRLDWLLVVRNIVLAVLIVPAAAHMELPLLTLGCLDGLAGGVGLFLMHSVASTLIALREPAAAFRRRFV